jgi:hypothetical protein
MKQGFEMDNAEPANLALESYHVQVQSRCF